MTDTPTTAAEMREAAAKMAEREGGWRDYHLAHRISAAIRAIPIPSAPVAVPGERIDYTAEQLRAMGEAYASAYADALAERAVSDDEMVERVARALMDSQLWPGAFDGARFQGAEPERDEWRRHARAAIAAMRGE